MRIDNWPMGSGRTLPVLIPNISRQRWSCHSCGNCCRSLVGHLTVEERDRLEVQNWRDELGTEPYVRLGRGWALNKRPDGACVFLDEANRCRIHARFGEAEKPIACRIFPFSVRPVAAGWQASFRFDCPSAVESKGVSLNDHRLWLEEVTSKLDRSPVAPAADLADLRPGLRAKEAELRALLRRLSNWVHACEWSLRTRVQGLAHLASTLNSATLVKTRGDRFDELIELLIGALPSELAAFDGRTTERQRAMLRQIVFVHAEHVTLSEARSGSVARWRMRWRQLLKARRLRIGQGAVPPVPGIIGGGEGHLTTFAAVESVSVDPAHAESIDELLERYLQARLEGRSVFGEGYYGWPVFIGMGALCAALAGAGWLARLRAAGQGRGFLNLEDVASALGIVDRAATRLPALGTLAERVRMSYLFRDGGLVRLIGRFWPGKDSEESREGGECA